MSRIRDIKNIMIDTLKTNKICDVSLFIDDNKIADKFMDEISSEHFREYQELLNRDFRETIKRELQDELRHEREDLEREYFRKIEEEN